MNEEGARPVLTAIVSDRFERALAEPPFSAGRLADEIVKRPAAPSVRRRGPDTRHMLNAAGFRKRLEYCLQRAGQPGMSQLAKSGLLQLASHWKEMAETADRVAKRRGDNQHADAVKLLETDADGEQPRRSAS